MSIEELGLTPSQLAELEHVDSALVTAWLDALETAGTRIHSPTGWFLAGVRSGTLPGAVPDNEREQDVRLAERWIRNAGLYEPNEPSLLDALFGEHGRLRAFAGDAELQARMLELWRHEQPRAEQAQAEMHARALRWQAGRMAMHDLGKARASQANDAQHVHSSQNSTALTAVSAHTTALDDGDIEW